MTTRHRWVLRGWQACGFVLCGALLGATTAHAGLFEDDEARRAILELRSKVDANRQAIDTTNQTLGQKFDDALGPTRRGLLELINQLEELRQEVARLRGANEQLTNDVVQLQQQQREVLADIDQRVRTLEPSKVTLDGQSFAASQDEKAAFDAAMTALRSSQFERAAQLHADLLQRYPGSGYVPSSLYWQGSALYAQRSYNPAIASYRTFLERAPDHPRVPDALLAIANCQQELKDSKAAKRTLEELVKAHPRSDAATAARERLGRLK